MAGGFFAFTGSHAELLHSLPQIAHIRRESDRSAMRWSLERLREELRDPQPGGSLSAQQLAYMMLVQALRLYLAGATTAGHGWLFALSVRHMNIGRERSTAAEPDYWVALHSVPTGKAVAAGTVASTSYQACGASSRAVDLTRTM